MIEKKNRGKFTSKFGIIAAAAGSAIGLGNIWKFPYITGEFGGAAFLFVYLAFIAAVGLPVMLSELVIGRNTKRNAFGAFKKLAPKSVFGYIGTLGVAAAFVILSFYGVVAGWSIKYIIFSIGAKFEVQSAEQLGNLFKTFTQSPVEPILYQLLFMVLTGLIVVVGIQKGIERYAKILMPILLLIIIILDIRAITLPGAKQGLQFLFHPDFSKLSTEGILSALGHAFFSLSLGMGTLVTYGSYISKKNNLVSIAVSVTFFDTLIAILAGIAIFPAVFAFNIEPSAGPGLVFITLPNVFQQMPGGVLFAVLFFVLLTVAALTSSISILEVVVAYFSEELRLKRKYATILATFLISILGVLCSLSTGILSKYTLFSLNIFDLMDYISANILLPLGGMFIALFIGWKMSKLQVLKEIATGGHLKKVFLDVFFILVKVIAPLAIAIVFLNGLGLFDFLGKLFVK